MLYKTQGIVLHSLPYKDVYTILHIYTKDFGRVSYLVSRKSSKRSSLSRSLFMPLSILDLEVEHLNKRDIQRIKEAHLFLRILEVTEKGIANFHLVFLLNLLHYLGIFPNTVRQHDEHYFDMLNGTFARQQPTHSYFLTPAETVAWQRILKMNYENMSLYSFSRQDRQQIIQRIFEYYKLHLPEFSEIRSLQVLQSLFD